MPDNRSPVPRWADALAIAAAGAMMLGWTWRTWPDPLIDFGRELYVPWQITLGRVLYKDIAYLNGPLSPYTNAAWMRLFGVSLTAVVAANLVVITAVILLLYKLLEAAADRLTALLGALVFIAICAFGRLLQNGNYNFVCPYSHEVTHGIVCSLGAIACLHLPRVLKARNTAAAGLLLGLVLLTKVEVALACGLAVLVGFALLTASRPLVDRLKPAALLFLAAVTPPVLAFALLCSRLPAQAALQGTLGSIYFTVFSHVTSSPFYRSLLGLDDLRGNAVQMAVGVGLICLAALVAAAAGLVAQRRMPTSYSEPAIGIAFVSTFAVGIFTLHSPHWFETVPKALPLVMTFILAVLTVAYARQPAASDRSRVLALRIALTVLSLGLLTKIFFNTRLYHYGFALAMPALLVLLAGFVSWLPRVALSRGGNAAVVRSVAVALATVMICSYLIAMVPALKQQAYRVGAGADSFLADGRGKAVQASLEWIDRTIPPGATLAVLPEGVMINYLSRRSNPTPDINLMPPELVMFGEPRVLQDFRNRPPDFVLLCHKDTTEYGLPLFGRDYGQALTAWVRDNYQEVVLIGNRPLQDPDRFGMLLLRRR